MEPPETRSARCWRITRHISRVVSEVNFRPPRSREIGTRLRKWLTVASTNEFRQKLSTVSVLVVVMDADDDCVTGKDKEIF